jgi:hypothetical protein
LFDAYYHIHGDTQLDKFKCISISENVDGTIAVLYHAVFSNADRIATLRKTDNGYLFISNLEK